MAMAATIAAAAASTLEQSWRSSVDGPPAGQSFRIAEGMGRRVYGRGFRSAALRVGVRPRCGFSVAGFGFCGGKFGGRERGRGRGRGRGRERRSAAARMAFVVAASAAMGGTLGSSDRKVAEALGESVVHKILTSILRIAESQRRRRTDWTSRQWTAAAILATGAIVATSLASKYVPRGAAGAMIAARFGILCAAAVLSVGPLLGADRRRLVREGCRQNYARAGEQLQSLGSAIWQTAHDSVPGAAAALSSGSSSTLDERTEAHSEDTPLSTAADSAFESQFGVTALATNENSSAEEVVGARRPDAESVVTEISQSVAHLMNVVSATDGAADEASLDGVRAGINDLCRELRCVEAALRAKQGLLEAEQSRIRDSEGISSLKSAPGFDDSIPNESEQPTSAQSPPKSFSSGEASANSALVDMELSSVQPGRVERSSERLAPSISGAGFVPAIEKNDGEELPDTDVDVVEDDGLPSEFLKGVVPEPVSALGSLSTVEDGDPGIGGRQHSSFTDTFVKTQKGLIPSSADESFTRTAVIQRRSSAPDPWQNDSAAEQPIESEDQALLDAVVVGDDSAEAEVRKDGIGNNKSIRSSSSGSVDFWGRHAGRIMSKTGEQRGILTKSRASGRMGTGFGSPDEWDNDGLQDPGMRAASEAEQRQRLRSDPPSTSEAGRPGDGEQWTGASGRAVRDDPRQRWREEDSSADAVDGRGRQMMRRGRDSDVRTDRALDQRGSRSGGNAHERAEWSSPQRRRDDPYGSQERRGRSVQARGDEDSYTGTDSRRLNDENPIESNRTWNPDGMMYVDDGELQNGKYSSADSPSQSRESERGVALQRSKEAQSVQFDRYLDQAEALLEEGMQGLEGKIEVGVAESMLYEAAKLLEAASAMDPTSLTAVGQWGNALLVHGELKLKVSQQIRSMLPSSKPTFSIPTWGGASTEEEEAMELTLQEVCEECEELLVAAGRKYRMALSIDKSDMRALYNWGLALCYRGQLIADDGGERAMLDADRVYLAAIDKFEAMMGIGSNYSAGALLNWGLAMRDRSRLRAMGDKERVQLLVQAKSLFQDAVRLDPNYGQARGAVAACVAELKELQSFKALQSQEEGSRPEKPSRSWWQAGGGR